MPEETFDEFWGDPTRKALSDDFDAFWDEAPEKPTAKGHDFRQLHIPEGVKVEFAERPKWKGVPGGAPEDPETKKRLAEMILYGDELSGQPGVAGQIGRDLSMAAGEYLDFGRMGPPIKARLGVEGGDAGGIPLGRLDPTDFRTSKELREAFKERPSFGRKVVEQTLGKVPEAIEQTLLFFAGQSKFTNYEQGEAQVDTGVKMKAVWEALDSPLRSDEMKKYVEEMGADETMKLGRGDFVMAVFQAWEDWAEKPILFGVHYVLHRSGVLSDETLDANKKLTPPERAALSAFRAAKEAPTWQLILADVGVSSALVSGLGKVGVRNAKKLVQEAKSFTKEAIENIRTGHLPHQRPLSKPPVSPAKTARLAGVPKGSTLVPEGFSESAGLVAPKRKVVWPKGIMPRDTLPAFATRMSKDLVTTEAPAFRAAGMPTRMSSEFPKDMADKVKTRGVGVPEIAHQMQKTIRTRINQRLRGPSARQNAGVYDYYAEAGAVRDIGDLSALTHEFGHGIDKKLWGMEGGPKAWKTVRSELEATGRVLYPDAEPRSGYAREGFADFLRQYLTRSEEIAERMPQTWKWWNETIAKQEPKLAREVAKVRELMDQYRSQGPIARIRETFLEAGNLEPVPLPLKVRVGAKMWDDGAVIQHIERSLNEGKLLASDKSPYKIYSALQRTAAARAATQIKTAQTDILGRVIGPSAEDIVKPVVQSGDMDRLMAYHAAKHAETQAKAGMRIPFDMDDVNETIRIIETNPQYQHIVTAKNQMVRFYENQLRLVQEAGGLSNEAVETYLRARPEYMPFYRQILDMPAKGVGKGPTIGKLSSVVQKARGSRQPLKPYIEQIAEYTTRTQDAAHKLYVQRALADLVDLEGAGRFIQRIDADDVRKISPEVAGFADELKKAGKLDDTDMDNLIQLFAGERKSFGTEPIIPLWRDGTLEYYRVHPQVYNTVMGMGRMPQDVLLKILSPFSRLERLGATGLRGGFMISNTVRDFMWSLVKTSGKGELPAHLARWLKATGQATRGTVTGGGEAFRLFRAWGIDISQPLGLDKAGMAMAKRSMMRDWKRYADPRGWLHALREGLSITEASPRMAEMARILEKAPKDIGFGDMIRAINAASDITVNFRRAGTVSRYINQIVPFFNPQVQGLLNLKRTLQAHPLKTTLRGVGYITVPTLGLWWLNKDDPEYQARPAHERAAYWMVKKPDGTYYKIPKPFEVGLLFGSVPEFTANAAYHKDKEGFMKSEFGRLANEAAQMLSPIQFGIDRPIGSMLGNFALIGPLSEIHGNADWTGRPIEPRRTQDFPKEARVQSYTTATARIMAKSIAGAMEVATGRRLTISPAEIDHLIGGLSGGMMLDVVKSIESAAGHPLKPEALQEAADQLIIGRFHARQLASRHVTEMFEEYSTLRARQRHFEAMRKTGESGWKAYRLSQEDTKRYYRLKSSIDRFMTQMDRLDRAKTKADAKKIRARAAEIARKAMK